MVDIADAKEQMQKMLEAGADVHLFSLDECKTCGDIGTHVFVIEKEYSMSVCEHCRDELLDHCREFVVDKPEPADSCPKRWN